jgi:hypothetical protein
MQVPRCPVCGSLKVILVVSPTRRAFCGRCGARWLQEGGGRVEPHAVTPDHPSLRGRIQHRASNP